MLTVEDWAEIRRLHRAEGLPIKMIARVLGISKNTVKSALESNQQPKYERAPQGSIVDAVEPRIRELLQAYPTMPATVIAERIGWERSIRVLSARVAELRPVYLPPDPASRTTYVAGEIAQCDFWFPPIELPVGFGQTRTAKQLPVLTMVCAYSRWLLAMLLPSRCAEDLFAGWWRLIEALGAVPRVLVWDGEGAISDRDAGLFVHRVGELAAAAEPVRGRCGERTREDTVEACQVRAEGGELRWLQRSGVRTINRRRTGEQVYGGKRQRVLIGTPVNVGPRRQFGRRIAGLAGNSEVGQQDPLVASTLTG